ncbi:hypothetical protein T4E_8147 [Trichinella pseudospiralis]|uniref:Uncharacterized protein n=1 Tax=Trichinella pseudospiralis TaxID=6337 RepID=A0A0V0XEJ6_TRIPS|nr:hypothetical protein T4E_8147 [Trichinella pseudospiralis]
MKNIIPVGDTVMPTGSGLTRQTRFQRDDRQREDRKSVCSSHTSLTLAPRPTSTTTTPG